MEDLQTKDIILKQSKKCKNCGSLFYRDEYNSNFTWKIKTFCCYGCQQAFNREKIKKQKLRGK